MSDSTNNSTEVINKLSDLLSSFICYSSSHLPDDVLNKLKEMREVETEGFSSTIYDAMFNNMEMADKLKRPSC